MSEEIREDDGNLIDVINLKKHFPIQAGLLRRTVGKVFAVDDVSFSIRRGETLGLVGESGCGKTTVGKTIMMLTPPTEGYVFLETPREIVEDFRRLHVLLESSSEGATLPREQMIEMAELVISLLSIPYCSVSDDRKRDLCTRAAKVHQDIEKATSSSELHVRRAALIRLAEEAIKAISEKYCINFKKKSEVRRLRGRIQFVFQDPFSSLNPRMLVKDIVAEPLVNLIRRERRYGRHRLPPSKETLREEVIDVLERVGLNPEHMYRFAHEFSGGQRQRIGIARALSVKPDFVVLDEPTSALDVSVQAQILNMLSDLQRDFDLACLFISHDLSTIRYMCDRVAVMYLGKIVESAPKDELYSRPIHPYTEALLSVIPVPDPDARKSRKPLTGDVPSPADPPSGCRFRTRCPIAIPVCSSQEPPLIDRGNEHYVACHVRKEDTD